MRGQETGRILSGFISGPDTGYYRFIIDFVSTHPSVPPTLTFDIDGASFDRKLPAGSGDAALTNARAGKPYTLSQIIPAPLFHAGGDTIIITNGQGSWALFDDIRLERERYAPANTLIMKAEPLPFFKQAPEGLRRAAGISIENLEAGNEPAELSWNSQRSSGSDSINLHFGSSYTLITVPDVGQVDVTLRTTHRTVTIPVMLPPVRKWKLYIVPTVHTDIGYTDLQDSVKVRQADNGVEALKLLDQFPNFKWYTETFWQMKALLQLYPEKEDSVFGYLRRRRWELSGDYANMLTGLCSSEALNRLTLDSRNLADHGGFKLNSIILDDVPSAVGSLPMVLANSGIKYFIEGANNDRAPYAGNVPDPFYWEGPDGSRVLADITSKPGYAAAVELLPSVKRAMEMLPPFLARFEKVDYPYDAVLVNGAFVDNREVQPWLPEVVRQWNDQWAYPKMIFAQPEDFFGYIETNFRSDIPILKTDFGTWWEDGAGSSALETAMTRRAEERIVAAEMLHSLASIMTGAAYPKPKFDECWHNILLYNEHTWGAAQSISSPNSMETVKQWEVKRSFAHEADSESRSLLTSGMAELVKMAEPSDLLVFNQLAWTRKALVETDLKTDAVEDMATKKIVPCQTLPEGGSCFIADDLPSIGYRSYRKAKLPMRVADSAVGISGDRIENKFYRITLDPKTGGIKSIYDKELARELVDTSSEYRLGELIYVTGGKGTYAVHSDLTNLPPPEFEYHCQNGTGINAINGPVYGELTSEATAEDFPEITIHVRLYRNIKRIDLVYELDKTATTEKEGVYIAFPFAVDASKGGLWLEYPDMITNPLKDQHASACRDWYAVQRWLAVSDSEATVELSSLDAPLFTFGHMTASTWPRELSLKRGHAFAYIMNNYWHTNYKAEQGGHFVFRYSITSNPGNFSERKAVMRGWDMFCPPVSWSGGDVQGHGKLPAAESLVEVEPAGLPLLTIKEAEDKDGFMFRCCDFAGEDGTAQLTLPKPVSEVFSCNLVETNISRLNRHGRVITSPLKPFAPLTLRVRFAH